MSNEKKVKLIPPDMEQCQTLISTYNPWVMGGSVHGQEQCTNKPTWIVKENVAGEDGIKGSMTVCDSCKIQLKKQRQDVEYIKIGKARGTK